MSRMINLLKTDLRRLLRGKTFYIMIGIAIFIPLVMLLTLDLADSTILVGPIDNSGVMDIMSSMMSIGILSILTGILISIFIGQDYNTGFIKNVMTVHANKYEYLISKAIICLIVNVSLIITYMIALSIGGAIVGLPLSVPSFGGFVLFILEKTITSVAFSGMFIFLSVLFRSAYGLAICGALFFGAGIISQGLTALVAVFNLPIFGILNSITVFGAGSLPSLTPSVIDFIIVFIVSAVWFVLYGYFSKLLLDKRDLI